ncbi:MAG: NADH-quinone oxidoreductase subunit J [Kiritimatiellia bacterium]
MIETFLLCLFAGSALAGGLLMILLRHPMRVAMALIATMISLGGLYGLLGVHEIAVFQIMIYVSAVMVFMVYAIMLLDVRDTSFVDRFSRLLIPGVAVCGLLAGVLIWRALKSPGLPAAAKGDANFGVKAFSATFLEKYWLHFELTSVLLLVAVLAAVAVVKGRGKGHG